MTNGYRDRYETNRRPMVSKGVERIGIVMRQTDCLRCLTMSHHDVSRTSVPARGSHTRLPPADDFSVSLSKDPDREVYIGVGESGEHGPKMKTIVTVRLDQEVPFQALTSY